jgi:hypothetical protein
MEKFLEGTGKRWPKSFKKESIITMVLTGLNLSLEIEGDLVIPFINPEKDGKVFGISTCFSFLLLGKPLFPFFIKDEA